MIKTTPTSGTARRPLTAGCAILLALAAPSYGQFITGQFSQANLGTGDSDALVGLSVDRDYHLAANLGNVSTDLFINGVKFTAFSGANTALDTPKFTFTGLTRTNAGTGGSVPGGMLGNLVTSFANAPANSSAPVSLAVKELTVGETYVITFYSRSWEAEGGRRQRLYASGASTVSDSGTYYLIDQDIGASAQGSLNVLRYTFRAETDVQNLVFSPVTAGAAFHQFGFSVERVFNNTWVSGPDWTTATWTGPTPTTRGVSAYLPAQASPTSINADQDFTLGHLQFEGGASWAITGAPERTITLQADVGGVSMLSVNSGTHTIAPNIALQNNLMRSGSGTLVLDGVISGDHSLHLLGGVTRLTGANTFTGETLISAGAVLEVTTLSDYGVPSSIGAREFAHENTEVTGIGLHFQGGTLRFVGDTPQSTNRQIRILNGDGATIEASGTTPEATLSFTHMGTNINFLDTGGARTLTLAGTHKGENTFGLEIRNHTGSNRTSLNKSGVGTWVLTGASTYTGETNVNQGTLLVTGTLASTPVFVGPGATFGGTGSIGGTVQINPGGRLSPGSNGTGMLTVASMTLNPFSLLDFELGGLSDNVIVNNLLSINGGALNLFEAGSTTPFTSNGTYPLFTLLSGGYSGFLGQLTVLNAQFGKAYAITDAFGNSIDVDINDTPITEWTGSSANGLWTTAGNWTAGTPNGFGAAAKFGNIPASATSVAVNGAKTVGAIQFDNANSYTITGNAGDYITFENGAAAGLIDVVSGSHTITAPIQFTGNLSTQVADGSVLTLSGPVENGVAGGIAHGGPGTLVLTGNNFYGPTLITGGTLQVGNGGATGSLGSEAVMMDPGTELHINLSSDYTLGMDILGAEASLTKSGSGTLTINAATIVGTDGDGRVTVNNGTLIVGSTAMLSPSLALTVNGGSLDLNGASLAPRDFQLNGGTITDLGNFFGSTTIDLADGDETILGSLESGPVRTLDVTFHTGTLQIGDGGTSGNLAATTLTMVENTDLVLNRADDFTVPTDIYGPGSTVTKLGAGTVTLAGINQIPALNVEEGVVRVGNANATSLATALNLNDGGFDLNGNDVIIGALSGTGVVTDNSAAAGTSTLTVAQDTDTTFTGSINDGSTRSVALVKAGTGTLELGGINSYTETTVQSGRLTVLATGSLSGGALTVNGGELLLQNNAQSVASVSGTGGVIDLASGHTLTASQEVNTEFAGALRGSGNFVKSGSGELTLSGDSAEFTGNTSVIGGSLVVNGDLSASTVQLNSALLSGEGSVGAVASLGGTIAPGAGVGTLSTGDLTLDANSSWSFQISAPDVIGGGINDLLLVNGSLTLDGTLFVSPLAPLEIGTYTLAQYSGSLTNNGMNIDAGFLAAYPGSQLDLSNPGEINLIVVVPEPGTGILLLGGMAMALGLRRRRQA